MAARDVNGLWVAESIGDRLLRHAQEDANGCWVWTGAQSTGGYASITINKKPTGAYRASYEHFVGPIPDGYQIDHLCRNRLCINPAHLEAVTPLENVLRRPISNKPTCPHGHPWDDANTLWRGNHRECRACNRARYHRNKQHRRSSLEAAAK